MPCFPPKLFVLRPLATGQHAAHEPLRTGGGAAAWTRALAKQDLFSIVIANHAHEGRARETNRLPAALRRRRHAMVYLVYYSTVAPLTAFVSKL